ALLEEVPRGARHDAEQIPRPLKSGVASARTSSFGFDFHVLQHLVASDGHRVALAGVLDPVGHDLVLVRALDVGTAVAADDVVHPASSLPGGSGRRVFSYLSQLSK